MKKIIGLIGLMLSVSLSSSVFAKNLGVIGAVYPITETDFIQLIQTRLQEKMQQGEWARWQTAQIQAIQQMADRPTPVEGLTRATQTRSWLIDPTIVLTQAIFNANGQVRFPAGARFNPLSQISWTQTLLFYDGDDPDQVDWVAHIQRQLQGQVLLILTKGSISQQTQARQQRVYFDQGGQLVKRWGITHLPTTVSQKGQQLQVTEITL